MKFDVIFVNFCKKIDVTFGVNFSNRAQLPKFGSWGQLESFASRVSSTFL